LWEKCLFKYDNIWEQSSQLRYKQIGVMGGSENAKQVHEKTARETFACRFLGDFFADF